MKFIVTYDLHQPVRNYQKIEEALRKIDAMHVMQSVWFVDVDDSCQNLFSYLKSTLDDNDTLFVSTITTWNSLRLPDAATLLKN